MCSTNCTHCLGATLLHMAILSMILNILLFFPAMQRVSIDKIPNEAWRFGGLLGSGVMIFFPATLYLRMKKLDCYGCVINILCVKSLSSGNAALFSCVGILGSSYGLFVALFAIYKGPKCFVGGDKWEYPFHKGGTDQSKPCGGLFITFYYAHRRSKNTSFSSSLENPAAFSSMQQPFWISTQVKNHMFKKDQ
ncbi:transmembrane 4 L6 family member 4-like isoform X2 [Antechinus flavipes]|uniref:transmembrane 4 L6 family member 4-like isoform X2 n=1 Tax=Antechinus flavipes TaxID=38775 RepID=UPI0022367BF9|nr:transmembrane 4 L6 family member 4-like isoform X2 [Antechinus flavipes]